MTMEMTIMTTRKTTKHPPIIIMERSVSATMAATGPFIWGGQICYPVLAVCRYFYLDVALVAQPSDIPGLAGELPLHSLSDLELSGRGENCRCE